MSLPPKFSRKTVERIIIWNNVAAWSALIAIAFLAPSAIGDVAWPIAFIIVGNMGFFTGTGSYDLNVLAKLGRARSGAMAEAAGAAGYEPQPAPDQSGVQQ